MIKIDERFSFERDKHNWILRETRIGKDKAGNNKKHEDLSFHATLRQVCNRIIDLKQGDCEDLIKLMAFTSDAANKLADEIMAKTEIKL